MNIVSTPLECRQLKASLSNQSIGFVPTMGNLHAGHASLIKRSKQENDLTIVSIFVNPSQFNQASDFDRYPRTIEADKEMLFSLGVDFLFLPDNEVMYPDKYQFQVVETNLSTELEGEYRPGHFNGMLTVVLKLLNIVQPSRAYFGEKDYQQFLLVKKMVEALFLPCEIVGCETVRAEDGLALSSRNSRLSEIERKMATDFARLLKSDLSVDAIKTQLIQLGFKVDYIAEKWGRRLGAVWLGDTRLIDNIPR